MKILILTNNSTGLYKFRREVLEELLKNNEVVVSVPIEGGVTDKIKGLGCDIIGTNVDRRGTNIVKDFKLLLKYIKLIKAIKPDVVLTYTIKPNIYGGIATRLLGVSNIANITGLGSAVENKGVLQKLTIFLYKLALKKSSCIFFQNKENQNTFKSYNISSDRHRLIPGSGVNLQEFTVKEYPNEKTIEFSFISRIMKEKGIEEYLAAAKYIKKKYPFTRFHICGFCEEGYEEELKSLQDQNIIKYHGLLDDISEMLKRIHCTVHPSYYAEGLSNVLLESAACGRPIITTDRSGCLETVDHEVNGFVTKQQNSQDLIEKIEKFIKLTHEEKEEMGLAGRRKVEREFDRNIVIEAYAEEVCKVYSKNYLITN